MIAALVSIRAFFLCMIFFTLLYAGKAQHIRRSTGWVLITIGFGFAGFGSLVDAGSRIQFLSRFELFSNLGINALVSEAFGHVLGLCFIAAGLLQWGPTLYRFYVSENKRREHEYKFQTIIDSSVEGIAVIQEDKVVFSNPSLRIMLGYSEEEISTISTSDVLLKSDHKRAEKRRKRILSKKTLGSYDNYEIKTKNGAHLHALLSSQHVKWDGIDSVLVVVSDITEHIQSEENLSTILNTASEAICIFQDDYLVYCNPAMSKMLDFTMEELKSRSLFEFIHPDDRQMVYRRYRERQAGEKIKANYDYRLISKSGEIVWVMISAGILEWKGKVGTVATLANVTDRKKTENELMMAKENLELKVEERTKDLIELNKQLMALSEQKSAFVSAASHELRTPLTSILGFSILVKKTLQKHVFPATANDPELEEKVQASLDNLDIIHTEGDRLTRLLNDMLDLSKIESGMMDWRDEQILIKSVVDIVSAGAKVKLNGKHAVNLDVSIEDESHTIMADQDRIIQILSNLLDNAIKFTEEGTITLSVKEADKGLVEFRVTDTGTGMTSKERDMIFHKYYQAESSKRGTSKNPTGTGLGLPICKEIVEHYGGKIEVEAGPNGCGSSFFVRLPLL